MKLASLIDKAKQIAGFCWTGVWKSTSRSLGIRIIKTINLSVRSFMDHGLQIRAAALTYSTVLAIVPALALLFAIGRGFGFQNLLQSQIYNYFPSQHQAIETALGFVDKYISQSSQGVFVGVGIIMLLWTLISLLSNIEQSFNFIWDINKDRSIYQKVTDYIAICLIIPVLMVCSSGVSIFMSTVLQTKLNLPFLTPVVNVILELFPLILAWLAFALSYYLIPNTKVQFKYAAIAGAVSAIGFQIIQELIVNGQIYVTKFNAIYGSFAFLPLLLVWLQLSWLLLLAGCVLSFSLQNVFAYNFLGNVSDVSNDYMRKVSLVVGAVIAQRFAKGEQPPTRSEISAQYDLPIRLVNRVTDRLHQARAVNYVILNDNNVGIAPAVDISTFTAADLLSRLDNVGDDDFIPQFNRLYAELVKRTDHWNANAWSDAGVLLTELPLPAPANHPAHK